MRPGILSAFFVLRLALRVRDFLGAKGRMQVIVVAGRYLASAHGYGALLAAVACCLLVLRSGILKNLKHGEPCALQDKTAVSRWRHRRVKLFV